MMSKPIASLSSGLLARKGQARPAMRPQGFAGFGGAATAAALDDLGWNDMGGAEVEPAPAPAPAASLARMPTPVTPVTEAPAEPVPVPPVVTMREALREEVETPRAARSVSVATATRIGRESAKQTKKGGKAAFTLRLDSQRHLRLRLASAVTNRSAQQIVTAAFDAWLANVPEVEALIAQLPPVSKSSR